MLHPTSQKKQQRLQAKATYDSCLFAVNWTTGRRVLVTHRRENCRQKKNRERGKDQHLSVSMQRLLLW